MTRTERRPEGKNLIVPVFVPSANGESEVQVGTGTLKAGTLVVEFKDSLGGVAIQRLFSRGAVIGLSMQMVAEDSRNLEAQARLAEEAAEQSEAETVDGPEAD